MLIIGANISVVDYWPIANRLKINKHTKLVYMKWSRGMKTASSRKINFDLGPFSYRVINFCRLILYDCLFLTQSRKSPHYEMTVSYDRGNLRGTLGWHLRLHASYRIFNLISNLYFTVSKRLSSYILNSWLRNQCRDTGLVRPIPSGAIKWWFFIRSS